MWLLRAGAHGEYNPSLISTQAWSTFQQLWSKLAQGKIDVAAAIVTL
jgi:hypothetical protein